MEFVVTWWCYTGIVVLTVHYLVSIGEFADLVVGFVEDRGWASEELPPWFIAKAICIYLFPLTVVGGLYVALNLHKQGNDND